MKPMRLVSLAALAAVLWLGLLTIPQPNAAFSSLAQASASPTFVPTVDLSDDPAFATPVPIPTLSITITPSGSRILPYVISPPPAGSDRLVTIYDVLPERFGRFSLPRIYGSEIRKEFMYDVILMPDAPLVIEYEKRNVPVRYALSFRYTRSEEVAFQSFHRSYPSLPEWRGGIFRTESLTYLDSETAFVYRDTDILSGSVALMQFRNVLVELIVGPVPSPATLDAFGLSVEDIQAIFRDVKAFMLRCPMLINCLPAGE